MKLYCVVERPLLNHFLENGLCIGIGMDSIRLFFSARQAEKTAGREHWWDPVVLEVSSRWLDIQLFRYDSNHFVARKNRINSVLYYGDITRFSRIVNRPSALPDVNVFDLECMDEDGQILKDYLFRVYDRKAALERKEKAA